MSTLLHGQFRGRPYSICISDVIEGVSSIKRVVFGLGIYTNTDSRCPRNLELDEIIWHHIIESLHRQRSLLTKTYWIAIQLWYCGESVL